MSQFLFSAQGFGFNFEYPRRKNPEDASMKNYTVCYVGDEKNPEAIVAASTASCNPKENFVKAIGRQVALNYVLESPLMYAEYMKKFPKGDYKAFQSEVRKAYYAKCPVKPGQSASAFLKK